MHFILSLVYWLLVTGSIILIFFNLPGTFFIAGLNLLYQLLDGLPGIDWHLTLILLLIAVGAEILEFGIMAWSSSHYGASRAGTVAAIIGSILGALLLSGIMPVFGTIAGAFGGAFAGAFIAEILQNKSRDHAFRSGYGAMIGIMGGKGMKLAAAIAMIVIMI